MYHFNSDQMLFLDFKGQDTSFCGKPYMSWWIRMNMKSAKLLAVLFTIGFILQVVGTIRYHARTPDDIVGIGIYVVVSAIIGVAAVVFCYRWIKETHREVTLRNKKVIIGLAITIGVVSGIAFFLLFPAYRYLVAAFYVIVYLLSPLIIYVLSRWEEASLDSRKP